MRPLVSINLCCYNSEKYLRETLQSIISQTYANWELVIVDDGSSDSTEAIISDFKNQNHRINYHYQQNKGIAASRNKALELSKGEYVAFIDHDDLWLPDKLEKQVAILEEHSEADFLYGNYFVMKGSRKMSALSKRQPQGRVFEQFLCHYPVAILTTVVRKKAVERLGELFDKNLALAEDFDFFLRLLYNSKAVYQDKPSAVYRVHGGMSSVTFMEKWPNEIAYVIKKFGCLYQNFENDYADALGGNKLFAAYLHAKMYMKQGNLLSARMQIAPYKFLNLRYFSLYIFSYMPVRLWSFMSLRFLKGPF